MKQSKMRCLNPLCGRVLEGGHEVGQAVLSIGLTLPTIPNFTAELGPEQGLCCGRCVKRVQSLAGATATVKQMEYQELMKAVESDPFQKEWFKKVNELDAYVNKIANEPPTCSRCSGRLHPGKRHLTAWCQECRRTFEWKNGSWTTVGKLEEEG